jgi:CRP-like cAMP-binding protein
MTERTTTDILEELLAWTKFANVRDLAETLRQVLDDKGSYRAYEASDGRTQAEVVKASGVTQPTVSRLWSKWRRLGLVRDRDGRTIHLASPSDLGLSPPE